MYTAKEKEETRKKAAKPLLWLGIISIIMLFAGLTSGYVVVQGDNFWVSAPLPQLFWVSTGVILLSSASLIYAIHSIRKNDQQGLKLGLIITFVLGLAFSATQYYAWKQMIGTGNFLAGKISDLKGEFGVDYTVKVQGEVLLYNNGHYYGPNDVELKKPLDEKINQAFNVSSGFKYILSGLHLAHLGGGLIYLLIVLFRAFRQRYNANYLLDLELGGMYWHFLAILWIYLFAFLYFIQ